MRHRPPRPARKSPRKSIEVSQRNSLNTHSAQAVKAYGFSRAVGSGRVCRTSATESA
jgi:hypothetical protein